MKNTLRMSEIDFQEKIKKYKVIEKSLFIVATGNTAWSEMQ
jgi:hypothetical protein